MDKKKTYHRGIAAAITASVLLGIILFNILFTYLANRFLWVIDTSSGDLVKISDTSKRLLKDIDPDANDITIYFLAAPDQLENYEIIGHQAGENNSTWGMSYIYNLAKLYERNYPFVHVGILDLSDDADYIRQNFAMTIGSTFSPLSIVIENVVDGRRSYRTYVRDSFYATSEDSTKMYFRGEDRFTSAILSLSGANPTAYFVEGHGEKVGAVGDPDDFGEATALAGLFREAGFLVKKIDLSKEDFLLPEGDDVSGASAVAVIFGPVSDFICREEEGINEISRLSHFLAQRNCNLMVFKDPGVPELPNLEEYLTDYYGVDFADDIVVSDTEGAGSEGGSFYADYELNTISPGSGLVSSLTELPTLPNVFFDKACSVLMNEHWSSASESATGMGGFISYKLGAVFKVPLLSALASSDGSFRTFEKNVYERYADRYYDAKYAEILAQVLAECYDDFFADYRESHKEQFEEDGLSEEEILAACAKGAEEAVTEEATARIDRWLTLETAQPAVMTLTHANWMYQLNESVSFYCLACGSTSFASNEILNNAAYGNRDVMFSAVYLFSRNVLPYDIDVVAVENPSVMNLSSTAGTVWTVILAVLIPLAVLGVGVGRMIKRKKHN